MLSFSAPSLIAQYALAKQRANQIASLFEKACVANKGSARVAVTAFKDVGFTIDSPLTQKRSSTPPSYGHKSSPTGIVKLPQAYRDRAARGEAKRTKDAPPDRMWRNPCGRFRRAFARAGDQIA